MYTLEILAETPEVRSFYEARVNYSEDSGVDLYVPETQIINAGDVLFLNHKIKCRLVDDNGKTFPYFLYPRSSISKTPLMLANSVGIIDKNYRGNIIAALRYTMGGEEVYRILVSDYDLWDAADTMKYTIEKGTRLVQICAPDLSPIQVRLVDSLDETDRSTGGFGSTGK